jgi:hypothetical protein
MRKWDHGSACKEDSPREDLEGGLTGGWWWLEVHWGGGNSLWAMRAPSRIGGPGKAAQILEEGNGSLGGWGWGVPGEQGQCWERTWSESHHQNVRKNAAHKESSWEKSHVQEQGLMAGLNCQAGQGNMAQHRLWARCGFYRRGSLRKLAHAQQSPFGVELS